VRIFIRQKTADKHSTRHTDTRNRAPKYNTQ